MKSNEIEINSHRGNAIPTQKVTAGPRLKRSNASIEGINVLDTRIYVNQCTRHTHLCESIHYNISLSQCHASLVP